MSTNRPLRAPARLVLVRASCSSLLRQRLRPRAASGPSGRLQTWRLRVRCQSRLSWHFHHNYLASCRSHWPAPLQGEAELDDDAPLFATDDFRMFQMKASLSCIPAVLCTTFRCWYI